MSEPERARAQQKDTKGTKTEVFTKDNEGNEGLRLKRLGKLIGVVRQRCVRLDSRVSSGHSEASPPYGVVKLRSEFLADFHVL